MIKCNSIVLREKIENLDQENLGLKSPSKFFRCISLDPKLIAQNLNFPSCNMEVIMPTSQLLERGKDIAYVVIFIKLQSIL